MGLCAPMLWVGRFAANWRRGVRIARQAEVSHNTVHRSSDRLGRRCLLFHEPMRPKSCPREPLVLDGVRSFEQGQPWPTDLNLLVRPSLFVPGFDEAELRRSGTMRPAQRVKRTLLEEQYGSPTHGR